MDCDDSFNMSVSDKTSNVRKSVRLAEKKDKKIRIGAKFQVNRKLL